MDTNDVKAFVASFEEKVKSDITSFLQYKGALDEHVPECPDVEERWGEIARAYLPDGAREFQDYPIVSLGWMMFIGMAMAYYWDTDWARYSAEKNLYESLRDVNGYDNLDETVVETLLGKTGEEADKVTALVAECASRADSLLRHEHIEPGTEASFGCYVASLHQLYLLGMAMELNDLGYHMTAVTPGFN